MIKSRYIRTMSHARIWVITTNRLVKLKRAPSIKSNNLFEQVLLSNRPNKCNNEKYLNWLRESKVPLKNGRLYVSLIRKTNVTCCHESVQSYAVFSKYWTFKLYLFLSLEKFSWWQKRKQFSERLKMVPKTIIEISEVLLFLKE